MLINISGAGIGFWKIATGCELIDGHIPNIYLVLVIDKKGDKK